MTAVMALPASPCLITAKKYLIQVGTLLFIILSFQMSNKELIALSLSEVGELEATMQNHSTVVPHNHEPLLGDGAQLDFDALCDNDDTAIAAFMNYLEAEGALGDSGDFSDIHWTL